MRIALPKLIGVIHLPALPGSPEAAHLLPAVALQKAGLWAVKEAQMLAKFGFDGLIIENFGDAPFYKTVVNPETIASMAIIAAAIKESSKLPLGINVLRNDADAALAIAAVTGADFIRVNVLSGVVATDQGMIEGSAAKLIREKLRLNAGHVGILADVHVKHARTLSSDHLAIAIEETAGRGGADAVIITGATTGRSPDLQKLREAAHAAVDCGVPVFIGSGTTPEGLKALDVKNVRMIVGSALRKGGKAGAPLDVKRCKALVAAWKAYQKRNHGKTRRATS